MYMRVTCHYIMSTKMYDGDDRNCLQNTVLSIGRLGTLAGVWHGWLLNRVDLLL